MKPGTPKTWWRVESVACSMVLKLQSNNFNIIQGKNMSKIIDGLCSIRIEEIKIGIAAHLPIKVNYIAVIYFFNR
jgi:hypothetical protein